MELVYLLHVLVVVATIHQVKGTISLDGTCGTASEKTCLGSLLGQCCSKWGWCGISDLHCGEGCQPGYGDCSSDNATLVESPDFTCGPSKGYKCPAGLCCSAQNSMCGIDSEHCGIDNCQPQYGECDVLFIIVSDVCPLSRADSTTRSFASSEPWNTTLAHTSTPNALTFSSTASSDIKTIDLSTPSSSGSSMSPSSYAASSSSDTSHSIVASSGRTSTNITSTLVSSIVASITSSFTSTASSIMSTSASTIGGPSPDGTCGSPNYYVCSSGLCCSQDGTCDMGPDHCGVGCQPLYGSCTGNDSSSVTSSSFSSSSTLAISSTSYVCANAAPTLPATNYLVNPGFENGQLSPWYPDSYGDNFRGDGSNIVRSDGPGSSHNCSDYYVELNIAPLTNPVFLAGYIDAMFQLFPIYSSDYKCGFWIKSGFLGFTTIFMRISSAICVSVSINDLQARPPAEWYYFEGTGNYWPPGGDAQVQITIERDPLGDFSYPGIVLALDNIFVMPV